jgi:TonB family protein
MRKESTVDVLKKSILFFFLFAISAQAQPTNTTVNVILPIKDCVPPIYPAISKSRNEQGSVEILYRVSGNGIVSDAIVKQSSGFVDLDNAAITAVKFCKFKVSDLITETGSIVSSGKFRFALEGNTQPTTKPIEQYKPASNISCDVIKYPAFARAFNKEGKTTVSFIVAVDGTTRNPEIKVSSGSDLLDSASKENIEKCKYSPATLNGAPIESVMQQNFNWRLATNKSTQTIEPPFLNLHSQIKICKNIEYPSASWRLEEEGTTRVKVFVSKDGGVEKTEIAKSSGFRRLDEATRRLVSNECQFEKLIMGNNSIPFSIELNYTWNMDKANSLRFVNLDISTSSN